mgnify:CR=1 FL=1
MKYVQRVLVCACLLPFMMATACTRHEVRVEPVEVKPIHITIDVNVRVDRALDDFFEEIDEVRTEKSTQTN